MDKLPNKAVFASRWRDNAWSTNFTQTLHQDQEHHLQQQQQLQLDNIYRPLRLSYYFDLSITTLQQYIWNWNTFVQLLRNLVKPKHLNAINTSSFFSIYPFFSRAFTSSRREQFLVNCPWHGLYQCSYKTNKIHIQVLWISIWYVFCFVVLS